MSVAYEQVLDLSQKHITGYKQVANIHQRYFSAYAGKDVEFHIGIPCTFGAPGLSFSSTVSTARDMPVGKHDFEKLGFRIGDDVKFVLIICECGGNIQRISHNRYFCTEVTLVSEVQEVTWNIADVKGSPHKCD